MSFISNGLVGVYNKKISRHDMAEIMLKLALNTNQSSIAVVNVFY
jgi:hypothetical protein